MNNIPPLTMFSPKKSMIRHKSQPKPVLSGQFTVITVGSPSFSDSLIITTSSYNMPIVEERVLGTYAILSDAYSYNPMAEERVCFFDTVGGRMILRDRGEAEVEVT